MLRKNKINKKGNSHFEFQFDKINILPNSKRSNSRPDFVINRNILPKSKRSNSRPDFVINRNILPKSKRSQITIFIILALIIAVSIILIFLLIRKPQLQVEDIENPQAYIDSCTKEFTEEAIDLLSEQGGDINPKGSTMFRGRNITYLCYNANFYEPCVMQRPDLITHIENEITNYIEPEINNCFNTLKAKLEAKNYIIEIGDMQLQTKLQTGKVVINIDRDFKMTKREETRSFNNFKSVITSPIYGFAEVAMEIANQEAKYCNFDILGYMIFYPDYDLDKFRPGNGDVIYQIRHIQTNKMFVLAVRSCALPPGF